MPKFDDKSVERISKTVQGFERQKQPLVPGKRFQFIGSNEGGGSTSQLFHIDVQIPGRNQNQLGGRPLNRVFIDESNTLVIEDIPEGSRDIVYNLRPSPIEVYSPGGCNPSSQLDLICLATDVGGKWIIQEVFYNFEAISVATGVELTETEFKINKSSVYVEGVPTECDPDTIQVSPCGE